MWILSILLIICIIAIIFLIFDISYKNHCIEDLEISKSRMLKRKQGEIMEILYDVQELTDFRKTYSKEAIRNYVNKKIELNTTATNENV